MSKWRQWKAELKEEWNELKSSFTRTPNTSNNLSNSDNESVDFSREQLRESLFERNEITIENRRNFVRMDPLYKLQGEMLLIEYVEDTEIRSEPEIIIFKNLSGNGLAILTNTYIDLTKNIRAEITFKLMDVNIIAQGGLVRLENIGNPLDYLYGLKIENSNLNEDELYKVLMKCGLKFKNITAKNSSMREVRLKW